MSGVTKAMWLKGIYSDASKMKANARDERNDKIRLLAEQRRTALRALEEEYKMNVDGANNIYKNEIQEIDAMTKRQIAQGPPPY